MPAERKFLETFEAPAEEASETVIPPPAVAPAPETQPEAPAKAAAEAPTTEPKKTEESKDDPKTKAYWAALADEREKRRRATEETAYWRGRAEAGSKPKEEDKTEQQNRENEFLTNPVGFTESMIQQRLAEAVTQDRWARSIYSVEREHKDWTDKRDKFLGMAKEDPTLEARAMNHPDPARYAYEYVKQRETMAAPEDLVSLKAKIRAEVEADLKKERALAEAGAIPQTLASASGTGGGGSSVKDHDVNDLFEGKSF
jgi:hypothetical protein